MCPSSRNDIDRRRRRRLDDGASAVEYALIVAGIAAVIVVIVFAVGSVLNSSVHKSCSTIETQFDGGTTTCDSAN